MATEPTAAPERDLDPDTVDIVIEANSNLVRHILKKYFPKYQYDEDMFQIGLIGLWKACLTYDPSKSEFSTFASICIMNRIRKELRPVAKHIPPDMVSSLDEPMGQSEDSARTLGDVIPDTRDMFSFAEYGLDRILGLLSPQELDILEMRVAGLTTSEIGKAYGKSQAWGYRAIAAIQAKLREELID